MGDSRYSRAWRSTFRVDAVAGVYRGGLVAAAKALPSHLPVIFERAVMP